MGFRINLQASNQYNHKQFHNQILQNVLMTLQIYLLKKSNFLKYQRKKLMSHLNHLVIIYQTRDSPHSIRNKISSKLLALMNWSLI